MSKIKWPEYSVIYSPSERWHKLYKNRSTRRQYGRMYLAYQSTKAVRVKRIKHSTPPAMRKSYRGDRDIRMAGYTIQL